MAFRLQDGGFPKVKPDRTFARSSVVRQCETGGSAEL